eukprot:12257-Heterococcus_DN1.PRE.2
MRSSHVSPNALNLSTTAGAAELTLTNDSRLHAVFKVRTTAPKSFRVHPACAVVQPESSKAVRIECRAEPSASCCDGVTFQIRYILLSAAEVAVLTDDDIKTNIWTAASMAERVSKLVVDALYVPSSSPTRSVSPRQQRPSSARSSSAVAAPSAHMLELLIKNVTKNTPLSDAEVSELRAARSSLTPEQWQQWLELARTAKAQRRRSSSSSSRQGGSSRASSIAASERVRTAVPAVAAAVQARTAAAPSYSTAPIVPVNPVQLRVLQEVTRPSTATVVADHQRQQSAAMLKAASVQLTDNAVDFTAATSIGRAVAAPAAPTLLQHEQLSTQQTRMLQATQQPAAVHATTAVAVNTPENANGIAHRSTPSPLKQQQQQQGLLPPHMITEMMTAQQCLGSAEAAAAATCSAVETAMWCRANTTAAADSSGSTTALDTAQLDALTAAMQAFRLAAAAARASLMSLARSNSNSNSSSSSSSANSANRGLNTAAVQSCVVRAHSAAQGARSAAAGLRSDVTRCCAGFNSDVALLVSALTKLTEVDVTDSEPSPKAVTNGHNDHNGKRIAHSPQQQQQQQRDSSDSISNSNSRKQQQQQQQQHTRGSVQMWCRVAAGVGSAIIQTNGTGVVTVNTGRGRLAFVFDRVLQQHDSYTSSSTSSSSNGTAANSDPSYTVANALQPQLEQLVHAAAHTGDAPSSVLTVVSTGCGASGKSSMLFGAGLAERGCASWLIESLLTQLQNSSSSSSSGVSVTVSVLELVGGVAVDLLSKHHTTLNTAHKLSATRAQASHSSAFFSNGVSIAVQSLAQWERVRAAITARRCSLSAASTTAATATGDSCPHPHSHCIVCISVAHSYSPQRSSKLYFVDLGEGDTPQDTAHSRVPLDAQQQWSETAAVVQGERQAASELLRDLRNSSSLQPNAAVYSATPLAHFTQEALCAAAQVVVITNVVGRGGAREQQEAIAALLYTETLNSSDDDAGSSVQDDVRSSSSRAPQPLSSPPPQQQQQQQQLYDFRQEPLQQQQRHYVPEAAARAATTASVIGGRLGASPRAVAVANSSSPVRSATAPVLNGGVHRRSHTSSSVSAGVVSGGSRLGSSLNAAGTAAMMMIQAPVLTPTGAVTAVSFNAGRRSGSSSSGGSSAIRPASAGPLGYSSHLYPNRGARESPRPAVKPFRFRS